MAAHAVTEATPAGEVDGLSPRRKAVPPGSLPLVPLAAFWAARSASATTRPPARCHDHDGPGSLLPLRTVAHGTHQPARTLWSVTAPRARPPLAGRRASLLRRRVGGAAAGASTDASALGPAAPSTRSAASSAAMGLWAVPDGGYAASTPIWLLTSSTSSTS